jgi:hypothetical protein
MMHTKEPWELVRYSNYEGFSIWGKLGEMDGCIAERWHKMKLSEKDNRKMKANAQRIVDCVNACQGTDNLNIVKEAGAMYRLLNGYLNSATNTSIHLCHEQAKELLNRIEATQ